MNVNDRFLDAATYEAQCAEHDRMCGLDHEDFWAQIDARLENAEDRDWLIALGAPLPQHPHRRAA